MYRNRVFRTVILPLMVALVATGALYFVTSSGATQRAQPNVQTGAVVVAMRPIPPRTVISADMVALQEMPSAYIAPGAVRSLNDCVGRIALVPLASGEILMSTNVTSEIPGSTSLSYAITPGKRAMTVQVDEISGVAGFPEIGDHIDVYVTMTSTGGERRVRLVLEDLMILAVGQDSLASQSSEPRELRGFTSVTLEVTPEQAAVIASAENQGRLRFVLRSVLDDACIGEFELPGTALTQATKAISLSQERRISFDLRIVEVDPEVLAGLGYGDLSGSVACVSGWVVDQLDASLQAGRGKVLHHTTLSTSNRIGVTYKLTGGARASDAAPGTAGTPYGVTVGLGPAYYGQAFVNIDIIAQMQTADVPSDGGSPSGRTTALTSFHRVPTGDGLLVLGLISPEEIPSPREGVTRMVLPGGRVSEALASGSRVLVVVIKPSV